MTAVRLLDHDQLEDGRCAFTFETPPYRSHTYADGKIRIAKLIPRYSQLEANTILQDVLAEAQGVYDTWMQKIDASIPPEPIAVTLSERGSTHGDYAFQCNVTGTLKQAMRATTNYQRLNNGQREALEMIAVKIGRILAGDPNFKDHWHDIAGYAKLAEDSCK